jgi:hypothetical protein
LPRQVLALAHTRTPASSPSLLSTPVSSRPCSRPRPRPRPHAHPYPRPRSLARTRCLLPVAAALARTRILARSLARACRPLSAPSSSLLPAPSPLPALSRPRPSSVACALTFVYDCVRTQILVTLFPSFGRTDAIPQIRSDILDKRANRFGPLSCLSLPLIRCFSMSQNSRLGGQAL